MDNSKNLLFQAAKKLFAKRGFNGVSVREIAKEADVHFGLIRYHYGDKLGLYRFCIEKYGAARMASAERFLTCPKTKQEFAIQIKYLIEDVLLRQLDDAELTKIALLEIEESGRRANDILKETMVAMAKKMMRLFTEAQKAGFLAKSCDPFFLTNFIQGSINHMVRTDNMKSQHFQFSLSSEKNRKKLVEQLHQLILDGSLS